MSQAHNFPKRFTFNQRYYLSICFFLSGVISVLGPCHDFVGVHPCRGYIAPEYLDNGVITVKADIYSLGVMIRQMVMGRNNQGATTDDVY